MFLKNNKIKKKSFIRNSKLTSSNTKPFLFLGTSGLVSLSVGRVCGRQLEAARKVIRRFSRKEAKTWITVFPQMPITKKPQEVRMGKGKGNIKNWVAIAKKGTTIFENRSMSKIAMEKALIAAKKKLSIKCWINSKASI